MPIPEGRTFQFESEDKIQSDLLEVFAYQGEKQWIEYKTAEFSCVCPFSGLPDFGTLIVHYIPDQHCVELKSLKYYMISYRNVGIYQEAATNKLFQDLFHCLNPTYLKITLIYQTRGGIDTTTSIEKGQK